MSRAIAFTFTAKAGNFASVTSGISKQLNTIANTANAFANSARLGFETFSRASSGLAGAFESTVGAYTKFDELNREVAATTGMTSAEMQRFAKQIGQLGVKTIFTTEQLQKAAGDAARLGASKDEVIPLVAAIADVATITKVDLSEAMKVAKGAMAGFNVSAKDLPKLSTLMIQMATGSGAAVSDMAEAFKKAAPPAKLYGNQIEDVIPALQIFRDQQVPASQAGNALANVFNRLTSPTAKAKKALRELGLVNRETGEIAAEVNPEMSKLPTILAALSKLDPKGANAIFGANYGPLIAGLVRYEKGAKNAAGVMDDYRKSLLDSSAVAKKAATVNSGMGFEVKQIAASFELAKTKVGELISKSTGLGGIFEKARKAVGGVVDTLNSIDPAKFRDITMRIIQPGNLTKVFETAVNGLLPSFLKVIPPAFFFGVRQMVTYMPLVAQVFAKGTVDLLRVSLVAIARGSGVAFATIVGSVLSTVISKVASVFADIVANVSSDWAEKIRSSSSDFASVVDKGTQKWVKSIKTGSGVMDDGLKAVTDSLLKVNVKQSIKGGEVLADSFGLDKLKDVLGAATDAMATFVKAQRSLAADLEAQRAREVAAVAKQQVLAVGRLETSRTDLARLVAERSSTKEFGRKAQASLAAIEARIQADKIRTTDPIVRGTKQRELDFSNRKVEELTASIQELKRTIAEQQARVVQIDQRSQTIYNASNLESVGRSRARARTAGGLSSAGEAR